MSNTTSREPIRISGPPEAIKTYLAENFSVDQKELEKVYNLLLIEDMCQTLKDCDNQEFFKSIDDIRDNINATVCQGMLLDTRVFLNTDNFKIEIYKKLPSEIPTLLAGLLMSDTDQKKILALAQFFFKIILVLADNVRIVGNDAICVCMLAWKFACENRDVPFGVENIMPQDNCPFQGKNGDIDKKSFGRTSWRCEMPPTESSSERHCKLTKESVKKTLEELEDKGVLTCFSIEKASYLFL